MYFSAHSDAPNVWSLDDGDSLGEVRVHEVYAAGIPLITRYRAQADNVSEPRAWLECFGRVTVESGRAVIESITEG
jgi:hypothetical protein